jgi:hypothetical protein
MPNGNNSLVRESVSKGDRADMAVRAPSRFMGRSEMLSPHFFCIRERNHDDAGIGLMFD